MSAIDSLILIKEQVDEKTFRDIIQFMEASLIQEGQEDLSIILELFDRPDLLDDISKALTGKTLKQHTQNYVKKAASYIGNKVKEKALKSNVIKNTIGKKEYDSALKDLKKSESNYNKAQQSCKNTSDSSLKRIYKEDAKHYNKEANKNAKRVSDIKKKYGF